MQNAYDDGGLTYESRPGSAAETCLQGDIVTCCGHEGTVIGSRPNGLPVFAWISGYPHSGEPRFHTIDSDDAAILWVAKSPSETAAPIVADTVLF